MEYSSPKHMIKKSKPTLTLIQKCPKIKESKLPYSSKEYPEDGLPEEEPIN